MKKKVDKKKKESGATVEDAISEIRGKFGDDAIMRLDQKPQVGLECVHTGSFGLDVALGIGGLPLGRIVELYGPESSGKTTLALHIIAEAQKEKGVCAYIDAEQAMDPDYAKKLGVKTNELLISQPNSGEQGLEILESLVRSGKFRVVVVDSVATLTPRDEIEGNMGDATVGRQARLMSQAMRKLVAVIATSKTLVIFINQIRLSIGVPYGNPEYTPGGKALKFFSSVRLEIRRVATIKKGEEAVGTRSRVKVVKNKVAPPFRSTEFDIMYGEGISREGEILALCEKYGIVSKSGSSYKYGDIALGRGYDASRVKLREDKKLAEELVDKIKAYIAPKDDAEAEVGGEE